MSLKKDVKSSNFELQRFSNPMGGGSRSPFNGMHLSTLQKPKISYLHFSLSKRRWFILSFVKPSLLLIFLHPLPSLRMEEWQMMHYKDFCDIFAFAFMLWVFYA